MGGLWVLGGELGSVGFWGFVLYCRGEGGKSATYYFAFVDHARLLEEGFHYPFILSCVRLGRLGLEVVWQVC